MPAFSKTAGTRKKAEKEGHHSGRAKKNKGGLFTRSKKKGYKLI